MDGFVSTKICATFHSEDQVSNRQEALDNYWLSRRWVARGAHFVSRRCQDHRDLCIRGKEIWWVLKWLFNAGYYVGFFVWHALGLGVFVQHNLETNGTLRPTTMSPTWATWTTFMRYSLHLSLQSLPSLATRLSLPHQFPWQRFHSRAVPTPTDSTPPYSNQSQFYYPNARIVLFHAFFHTHLRGADLQFQQVQFSPSTIKIFVFRH